MTNLNEFPRERRKQDCECDKDNIVCGCWVDDYNDARKQCLEVHNRIVAEKDKRIKELTEALQFCIGKEVFGQGVCAEDKPTEAYIVATKALAKE